MILKWLFDRLASLVGLIVLSPILIVVAILIKVRMPSGPVFFKQERVGKYGKLFTMIKFRTMKVVHNGSPVSVAGEKRITPFGERLRRYKIDELPELLNVLIGDMSFVGPRPDVPGYADRLEGNDKRILELRPGVTGPASLKYRHEEELIAEKIKEMKKQGLKEQTGLSADASDKEIAEWYNDHYLYPDKVRMNLYYLDHYSFIKDVQMILCTIFGKRMSYGGEII